MKSRNYNIFADICAECGLIETGLGNYSLTHHPLCFAKFLKCDKVSIIKPRYIALTTEYNSITGNPEVRPIYNVNLLVKEGHNVEKTVHDNDMIAHYLVDIEDTHRIKECLNEGIAAYRRLMKDNLIDKIKKI